MSNVTEKASCFAGLDTEGNFIMHHRGSQFPALKIDKKGAVSHPGQLFYSTCLNGTYRDLPGENQIYPIIPNYILKSIGEPNPYNKTDGKLTSRYNGVWRLTGTVYVDQLLSAVSSIRLILNHNERKYYYDFKSSDTTPFSASFERSVYMMEGDQAWMSVNSVVFATPGVWGYSGDVTNCATSFSGFFLG